MTVAEHSLVEALSRVEGLAEIINGELVHLPITGKNPHVVAFRIAMSLERHTEATGESLASSDGLAYIVDLPHRQSFAPDAAYYVGPDSGSRFCEGAPRFAAEVRSENDYGPRAERAMAAKRADYFAAGTLVVWDVDTKGEDSIRAFRDGDAETPAAIYRRGDTADAEPAVSGWTFPVDDLFPT